MDFFEKVWLTRSKVLFHLKPVSKRVHLEIRTDGRHLAYLLVSLHALGFAVYVKDSPVLFRELLCLRKSTPIPFVFGGKTLKCNLFVSDSRESVARARSEGVKAIFLDYDFFGNQEEEIKFPYFMHPSVYHNGFHNLANLESNEERPVRLGFFGTRDAHFYTRKFYFPMMNREEILKVLFENFGDRINTVETPVSCWQKQEIVISLDSRGGDRSTKSFLRLPEYLQALRQCDFFLSPPGWCMPLSHNLIEGMAAGAVPIINSSEYLYPKLVHGKNCLSYSTPAELHSVIEAALAMASSEIKSMRKNVMEYYNEFLMPARWLKKSIERGDRKILVNAEEISLKINK